MIWSAIILGFLGSFHCVGMCGPIAFMLPVDRSNSVKKVSQIFTYHFGRLLAYSIIGLFFGLVGKSLYIFGLQRFLPCGLVYMGVFASLAMSSAWQGSLYMALFGLGTIPLMTTAIYLGKFLNATVKQRIQKAIPVFVIIIGALFIIRGLGLGIPYLSPAPAIDMATGTIDCH